MDLAVAAPNRGKFRRDWGLQNMVGMDTRGIIPGNDLLAIQNQNAAAQHRVRGKIAQFTMTAIFPMQLTVPRQYATTRAGCWVYKILEGRKVNGVPENGVRVVVQENAQQARFVMSPLFGTRHDALQWAQSQMGAEIPSGL